MRYLVTYLGENKLKKVQRIAWFTNEYVEFDSNDWVIFDLLLNTWSENGTDWYDITDDTDPDIYED